jgi:hypothetical protein
MVDLSAKPRSDIAAMDLFVLPTIGFKLLYGFVIVRIEGHASLSFRFSGSVSQIHAASLVDFITNTLAFRFSVHTRREQAPELPLSYPVAPFS